MMTTKIDIKPHLAEYLIGKYNGTVNGPIHFPDSIDLYHTIWDLLEKRPLNCSVDKGNLEIYLPDREIGKAPETYNYIGIRSQSILERKIEVKMWSEIHDLMDENKHKFGIGYIETVHLFLKKYDITSISEDAFIKNYYRWRELVRKKSKKREYRRV